MLTQLSYILQESLIALLYATMVNVIRYVPTRLLKMISGVSQGRHATSTVYIMSIHRSSKISFVGLSTFLVCPGAFALLTTPSSVVNDLIQHQFKLSSATLSWLSATVFVFHLMRFNTSVFT